ncbi:hypothetical protein GCM10027321_36150 [Massilia terrae]
MPVRGLVHTLPVDFVILVRMDELNDHVAQIYLLPKAEFPKKICIWPSTLTLDRYEHFSYKSMAHVFGVGNGV